MKIVIVTAINPHTLYLCYELSKKYEVVGIFFFKRLADMRRDRRERFRLLKGSIAKNGVLRTMSATMASWLSTRTAVSLGYDEADQHFQLLLDGRFDPSVGRCCEDINSPDVVAQIRGLEPDVVVCHGGPRYKMGMLTSADLVINYHSGVSPYYNGAHTHAQALANGDYRYCGGTLMVLNDQIDGGPILGHFLPSIRPSDSASDLFIKLMYGSFELIDAFLDHYQRFGRYESHPQPPCKSYFYLNDWNLGQYLKLLITQLRRNEHQMVRNVNEIRGYWAQDHSPDWDVWSSTAPLSDT